MRLRGIGLVFLLVSAFLEASDWGLMDQPSTFPWSAGLSPSSLEESGGLSPGSWRLRTSTLWFNTFRVYGTGGTATQLVDMEAWATTVSAAWSPAPGWELRGQAQGWVVGSGILDPFLSGFHSVFGFADQGRSLVRSNGYRVYLADEVDDRNPGAGLVQASSGVRWFSGSWSASAWTKVPVPAHREWSWSDRWGAGLAGGWGDRWPWPEGRLQFRAGGNTALVLVQPDPHLGAPTGLVTVQTGFYAGIEAYSGVRLLSQGVWTKVPRRGEGYLSMAEGLLTIGLQWPLGRTVLLELGVAEEFFTWATMEVGLQAGLVWRP